MVLPIHKCPRCAKRFLRKYHSGQRPKYCSNHCAAAGRAQKDIRGENNPTAKLTAEQVNFIRTSTMTLREIEAAGITTRSNASLIRRGKSWTHLNG